jgi:hypothetical protein
MALPANQNYEVSATGGAGASGQAKQYIPGMSAMGSSGTETMAQQSGAAMYKEANSTPTQPRIMPLTAPSEFPNIPVTDGAASGPGVNAVEGLPPMPSGDPDLEEIRTYYPILQFYASQPGASQGTKDYVSYLGTII